jgi:cytochrome c oxidase subunit II
MKAVPAGLAMLALLALAPPAAADLLSPESGPSPNAERIDTLYWIGLIIAIPIFLLVEGVLIWCLIKYRARRGAPEAAQIRGNTRLELGWTVGAASITILLAAVTFVFLNSIKNPESSTVAAPAAQQGVRFASVDQPAPPGSKKALEIVVNGQQYLWRYDYSGREQLFAYYEMVVPTDTTVVLEVSASDVIHSWWIPKLGGKVDGVPGHINETWFKVAAGKEGIYTGQCAELCGAGHADMRARVRAVTPNEFEDWARRTRADIQAAGEALAEQRKRREREGEEE